MYRFFLYEFSISNDYIIVAPLTKFIQEFLRRKKMYSIQILPQAIEISALSTFFFLHEPCVISYKSFPKYTIINYEFNPHNFLIFIAILLIMALCIAYTNLLVAAIFFISLFSAFVVVRHYVIRKFIDALHSSIVDILSDKAIETQARMQQVWLRNPHVCPACGNSINHYTTQCAHCGLYITTGKHSSRFSVSENLQNYTISYTLTNEED